MKKEELEKLIEKGESRNLELKELKEVEGVKRGGENGISIRTAKGLARGDEVSEDGIHSYKEISRRGEVWVDSTDEEGGSFDTSEYCRGAGQTPQEIIYTVSLSGEGVSLRSDNIGEIGSGFEILAEQGDGTTTAKMQRYSGDAKRVDQQGKGLKLSNEVTKGFENRRFSNGLENSKNFVKDIKLLEKIR